MEITAIPALSDNYIWALAHDGHAVIIDPGEAEPVKRYLAETRNKLLAILITHHHWDHTNGIEELVEIFKVPVFTPKNDSVKLSTIKLAEGDLAPLDNFPIKLNVLDIPGHTKGHIAYYGDGLLFCGDTLFASGCGRVFEGTHEQMYASLQKLANLPKETKVYCAHEYTLKNLKFAKLVEPINPAIDARIKVVENMGIPTLPSLMKDELKTNPFLRCDKPGVIKSASNFAGTELISPTDVFRVLRSWKDDF